MKTILTVEESQRLIELGVDRKLASTICINFNGTCAYVSGEESETLRDCVNGQYYTEECSCFSLADILSILPKEINHQCLTIISTDKLYFAQYGKWDKEYIHSWEQTFIPNDDCGKNSSPELIDALNQLLIWCLEQKNQTKGGLIWEHL